MLFLSNSIGFLSLFITFDVEKYFQFWPLLVFQFLGLLTRGCISDIGDLGVLGFLGIVAYADPFIFIDIFGSLSFSIMDINWDISSVLFTCKGKHGSCLGFSYYSLTSTVKVRIPKGVPVN